MSTPTLTAPATPTYAPVPIPAVLPRTIDEVRTALRAELGTEGIPNAHWPVDYGQDCLGFLTWGAGIRPRDSLWNPLISIDAFRATVGWHEVRGASDLRVGDWVLWDWDGDGKPEHAEFLYSIDRAHDELTTDSANTGPKPGVLTPRGVWQKARPLSSPEIWGAVRPPYAQIVTTSKDRKQVLTAATYLDKIMPASIKDESTGRTITLHRTDAGNHGSVKGDGKRGPLYRRLVQAWGRMHGIYGNTYRIDDVFGPRSIYVEERLFTLLKVG